MTKPDIPGFDAFANSAEFFQKIWGGAQTPLSGMPGMVMPTLSVEEIDKQIADMKSVEGWLDMNRNMLRATIQALEVQRTTLVTLRAMGETFRPPDSAGAQSAPKKPATENSATSSASATQEPAHPYIDALQAMVGAPAIGAPAAWWDRLQTQFNQTVQSVMEQQPSAASADKKATPRKAAPASASKRATKSGIGKTPAKKSAKRK